MSILNDEEFLAIAIPVILIFAPLLFIYWSY